MASVARVLRRRRRVFGGGLGGAAFVFLLRMFQACWIRWSRTMSRVAANSMRGVRPMRRHQPRLMSLVAGSLAVAKPRSAPVVLPTHCMASLTEAIRRRGSAGHRGLKAGLGGGDTWGVVLSEVPDRPTLHYRVDGNGDCPDTSNHDRAGDDYIAPDHDPGILDGAFKVILPRLRRPLLDNRQPLRSNADRAGDAQLEVRELQSIDFLVWKLACWPVPERPPLHPP